MKDMGIGFAYKGLVNKKAQCVFAYDYTWPNGAAYRGLFFNNLWIKIR